VAAAWKGQVYVHVEADDERAVLVGLTERLVAGVAERAPGETTAPAILRSLPSEGRVPRSERYVARDLRGHSFLPGGVEATYDLDGREAELYFSELRDAAEAEAAVARLRAHHTQGGAVVREVRTKSASGFRHEDANWGNGLVVAAGRFVAGFQGQLPDEAQRRLLDDLVAGLDR
jgi:hypothetical protein